MTDETVTEILIQLYLSNGEHLDLGDPAHAAAFDLWARAMKALHDDAMDGVLDTVAERWQGKGPPPPARVLEWVEERNARSRGRTRPDAEGCAICSDTGAPWHAGPGRVSLPLPSSRDGRGFPKWQGDGYEAWTIQETVLPCQCRAESVTLSRILRNYRNGIMEAHQRYVEKLERLAREAGGDTEAEPRRAARGALREAGTFERGRPIPALATWRNAQAELHRMYEACNRMKSQPRATQHGGY